MIEEMLLLRCTGLLWHIMVEIQHHFMDKAFEITSKFDIKHAQKPITNISCITHVGLH